MSWGTEYLRDSVSSVLLKEFHDITFCLPDALLTVGGGTTRCLQTLEAGGLGEGWSDALANWFNQNSSIVHDFAFGGRYSAFMLREFPYSVDTKKNPQNYSWGGKPGSAEVHSMYQPRLGSGTLLTCMRPL
jgi:extracellular elastinolytic metalloproteinase